MGRGNRKASNEQTQQSAVQVQTAAASDSHAEAAAATAAAAAAAAQQAQEDEHERWASIKEATVAVDESRQAWERRRLLREANTAHPLAGEAALRGLDASVKRNTALIKKLRQITEEGRQLLLDEVLKTNQSKYVTEAVAAVAEASLKTKDVGAAVQICSVLHQRYAEFGPSIGPALVRTFSPAARTPEEEKAALSRRRSAMRLLAELIAAGVVRQEELLTGLLKELSAVLDFQRDRDAAQAALSLLSGFAKSSREDFWGPAPTSPATLPPELIESEAVPAIQEAVAKLREREAEWEAEVKRRWRPTDAVRQQVAALLQRAFEAACTALEREHNALLDIELANSRILNTRGEVPEEVAAAYEGQRRQLEALQRPLAALAETLERQLPQLRPSHITRTAGEGTISVIMPKDGQDMSGALFEDEEMRLFYEVLPDLHALVPSLLLEAKVGAQDADADTAAGSTAGTYHDAEDVAVAEAEAGSKDGATADETMHDAGGEEEVGPSGLQGRAGEVRALLAGLPNCISRDACDTFALSFCYINSKAARKNLVRALCDVPRGSLQLLPYYARIAATISQVFPEVAQGVVRALEEEFQKLLGQKDATSHSLEARLRNARYLGELAKFRALPYGTLFTCLKALLDDFSQHNVDAAAALVETAGRFLYRTPETHTRMANMAEVMLKLRNARNLDARQSMVVEAAYWQVKPPERAALRRKQRPPAHDYIRHLLFDRLTGDAIQPVMKKLRRLPWAENEAYLVRCLLKAVRGRFSEVPYVAALAAGLAKYHPSLGVAAVDALLEEVRTGLDHPDTGVYQRRVGHMRLLGEMYNFRLIDSRVVFDTLYLLLFYGNETPELAERLDPPTSYFRIRLVCTLLEACGTYFSRGQARRRLERFATYFQRYLLAKPPLPLDVEFEVQDLLEVLQLDQERFSSLGEAAAAVARLEAQEAGQAGLGAIREEEEEEEDEDDGEDGSDRGSAAGEGGDGTQRRASAPGTTAVEEAGGPAVLAGASAEEEEEEEEEAVQLLRPLKLDSQEIDEDFEREFAALLGGSQVKGVGIFPAPQPPSTHRQTRALPPATTGPMPEPLPTVGVKVMMKRGGREERSKEVQVPLTAAMAATMAAAAQAQQAERAHIKRLVLQANKAQEAEGMPDADSIITMPRQPAVPQQQQQQQQQRQPRSSSSYPSRGASTTAERGRIPHARGRGRRLSEHRP